MDVLFIKRNQKISVPVFVMFTSLDDALKLIEFIIEKKDIFAFEYREVSLCYSEGTIEKYSRTEFFSFCFSLFEDEKGSENHYKAIDMINSIFKNL